MLLLVSWNGEPLQEITKNLELKELLRSFSNVGVLSLATDDPDIEMETVMADLVERSRSRSRMYLDLGGELMSFRSVFQLTGRRVATHDRRVETMARRRSNGSATADGRRCKGHFGYRQDGNPDDQ